MKKWRLCDGVLLMKPSLCKQMDAMMKLASPGTSELRN